MPGLGLPRSLGTTISTTSPRVISTIPNRRPTRSNHRSRHFPDAAQLYLTANLREHLRIAQVRHPMLHRPQPLRAQALAARSHALLGCSRFCLFGRGRGHGRSVTCYGGEFSSADAPLSTFSAAINASCGMSTLPNCRIFLHSFLALAGRRLLADQTDDDHGTAESADAAGDLSDRAHQGGRIVRPRHHAEHYQKKRAGKTKQHDANDNQPPVPLPHDKRSPVPSVDERIPTQRIVPSTFIWVQSMSKDSGLG